MSPKLDNPQVGPLDSRFPVYLSTKIILANLQDLCKTEGKAILMFIHWVEGYIVMTCCASMTSDAQPSNSLHGDKHIRPPSRRMHCQSQGLHPIPVTGLQIHIKAQLDNATWQG